MVGVTGLEPVTTSLSSCDSIGAHVGHFWPRGDHPPELGDQYQTRQEAHMRRERSADVSFADTFADMDCRTKGTDDSSLTANLRDYS